MSGAVRQVTRPEDDRHGPPAAVGMTASAATTPGGSAPSEKTADRREEIFGSFDGMTSTLGVIAGLLATGASASKILAAAIASPSRPPSEWEPGIPAGWSAEPAPGRRDGAGDARRLGASGDSIHIRRFERLHPRIDHDHARSGRSDRPLPRIPITYSILAVVSVVTVALSVMVA